MAPAAANLAIDTAAIAERALDDYLAADRAKPLLRFVTCGSVDDGKSTLIGRLLYDSKRLFQDQLAVLESDSRKFGTQGQKLDFALLVDGLSAEREQGITIDVAYRYFATDARKFIVADAPGHVQYTRNMATAASTADLAVILIDATRGISPQTRRHSHIVRLLGVRSVVLAVNKMDLVGYDRDRFAAIVADYDAFAAEAGLPAATAIPMAAVDGDNVTQGSAAMPWYDGPTLIAALEGAPTGVADQAGAFAMPVQWVNRSDASFRGFAGTVASGTIRPGDAVEVLPGGQHSRIARIVTFDGDLPAASAGQAVTLALTDEIECAAGATLAAPGGSLTTGNLVQADLVWLDEAPLVPHRRYLLQLGARRVSARVAVERLLPIDGAEPTTDGLAMNGIAAVTVTADVPIAALPYTQSHALGAFILIDRETNATVAAGMVRALSDSGTVNDVRAAPIYTFAAGSAEAGQLVTRLRALGTPSALLDAPTLREGIAADVPAEAIHVLWRRAVATAELLAGAGVTVALAIDPPADAVPFGAVWANDDAGGDWVI